jgi:hypothetical protein
MVSKFLQVFRVCGMLGLFRPLKSSTVYRQNSCVQEIVSPCKRAPNQPQQKIEHLIGCMADSLSGPRACEKFHEPKSTKISSPRQQEKSGAEAPLFSCNWLQSNASVLPPSPNDRRGVSICEQPNAGVPGADDPSGLGSRHSGRLHSGDNR